MGIFHCRVLVCFIIWSLWPAVACSWPERFSLFVACGEWWKCAENGAKIWCLCDGVSPGCDAEGGGEARAGRNGHYHWKNASFCASHTRPKRIRCSRAEWKVSATALSFHARFLTRLPEVTSLWCAVMEQMMSGRSSRVIVELGCSLEMRTITAGITNLPLQQQ